MKMDYAQELELAALVKQEPILDAIAAGESEVQRFYKNCTVFVTGGSGFLGKQLLEKLLRSCQISRVYLLLRPKKGKPIEDRINEFLKDPVFNALRKQQPEFSDKIQPIKGDVAELKLGINDEDWNKLTEEVDVLFHVAATTRFDEPLRTATLINVRGTREALALGKACKRLRSYVHVSTAYSHATTHYIEKDVKEKFYASPIPPEVLISLAETMDMDRLNNITKPLIKDWPNSYTFTKAIAEEQVRKFSAGLPVCIVRPAIVLGTYLEPLPGWVDMSCIYGIIGLTAAAGIGVLQTSVGDLKKNAGFIPCDYVNNACIVAARETASNQAKGGDHTKIYTVCTTHRNPVSYGRFSEIMRTKGRLVSTPKAVYYPDTFHTTSLTLFHFLSIFVVIAPAYLADLVCLLMGKPMRYARLVKKLPAIYNVLAYFNLNEWYFIDNNVDLLYKSLSKQDQTIFNFDSTKIDWEEFFVIQCIGIRKYILKDGLQGTAYALKKQKYLKVLHYVVVTLYAYLIWKVLSLGFLLVRFLISLLTFLA